MKVSLHSQREYERNIQQLSRKLERAEQKYQSQAKDIKYLKRRVRDLSHSRDKWKSKNTGKALKIKELKKALVRSDKVKRHHYPLSVICLCVKLRVIAGCSYRGICKILLILQSCFELDLSKLPCANFSCEATCVAVSAAGTN